MDPMGSDEISVQKRGCFFTPIFSGPLVVNFRECPHHNFVTFNDIGSIAQKLCSELSNEKKHGVSLVVWIILGVTLYYPVI